MYVYYIVRYSQTIGSPFTTGIEGKKRKFRYNLNMQNNISTETPLIAKSWIFQDHRSIYKLIRRNQIGLSWWKYLSFFTFRLNFKGKLFAIYYEIWVHQNHHNTISSPLICAKFVNSIATLFRLIPTNYSQPSNISKAIVELNFVQN